MLANGGGPTGPEKNLNLGWKSRITLRPLIVPVNGVLLDDTRMYGGVPDAAAVLNVPRSCPDEVACH